MMFDDEDDLGDYDDGEAFANTLVHIGQGLIGHLFRYRATHWPMMPDRDFLPILDGVREYVGELLGPEQLKELWEWVCGEYQEQCEAKDPKVRPEACAAVLQSCLPEWHEVASAVKQAPRREKGRGKKRKK